MLHRSLTIAFSLVLWTGLASAQANPEARTSSLKGANGQVIGQVTVTAAPNGVILRVQAKGLAPGWHGMHFHEKVDAAPRHSKAPEDTFMQRPRSFTGCSMRTSTMLEIYRTSMSARTARPR